MSNPNGPQLFPCGGGGQQPCPPEPALTGAKPQGDPNTPLYTHAEHMAYGKQCFDAGIAHQAQKQA